MFIREVAAGACEIYLANAQNKRDNNAAVTRQRHADERHIEQMHGIRLDNITKVGDYAFRVNDQRLLHYCNELMFKELTVMCSDKYKNSNTVKTDFEGVGRKKLDVRA